MLRVFGHKLPVLFNIIVVCLTFSRANGVENNKVLNVGAELFRETLPLRMGSHYYKLRGLKPDTWYEVKISYPASIPAIFSLQLRRGDSDTGMNMLRKLLHTEKIIFKNDNLNKSEIYVLVTVEPEGVVALPGVQERETILFNIVCDELLLGLPYKAWPVIVFAVICLAVGFLAPHFLPPFLLPRDEDLKSVGHAAADKDS